MPAHRRKNYLFLSRITLLVNVDLLIQDDGKRALAHMAQRPIIWPGRRVASGFIRHKERTADRINLVAKLELATAGELLLPYS
jgi:hypothetical protein